MKKLLAICVLLGSVYLGIADYISSTHEANTHSNNSSEHRSAWMFRECPTGMIKEYLPSSTESSSFEAWRCQCNSGHVYLPTENACYLPYRRGPCPQGHYVYLGINETVPQCAVNPCFDDSLVPYNGTCHKIGMWKEGPCNVGGLVTDPEDFQLKCIEEINRPLGTKWQLECSSDERLEAWYSEDVKRWTCECMVSRHAFYPLKNKCYEIYRQGPCSPGHYIYMAKNESVAECVANPCIEDGLVLYNGTCHQLGAMGDESCNAGAVVIDPKDFQPKCIAEVAIPLSAVYQLRCPRNTLLKTSLSNDPSDWECHCVLSGEVYFPSYKRCYQTYRQGPCPTGHYVYLAINETVPKCVVNPCFEDGLVSYNGSCHKFGALREEGACVIGALVAHPDTFQLTCYEDFLHHEWVIRQIQCPGNLKLVAPSDNLSDWHCGCGVEDVSVYLTSHNGCYDPYRKGPCPPGHYVYRGINETAAQCVVNPCFEDGLVPFKGSCYKFGAHGEPCGADGYLYLNIPTYELVCHRPIPEKVFVVLSDSKCPPSTTKNPFSVCVMLANKSH